MKSFGPDETLCDVYKRKYCPPFQFHWRNQIEPVACGEIYEISSPLYHQFKAGNEMIRQFNLFKEQSLIIIISGGNTTLDDPNELDPKVVEMNEEGKIKEFHVTNPTQLLALLHLVKSTIFAQDIMFVFHSLTALLVSEKTSTIHSAIFQSIKEILVAKLAYGVWLTSTSPSSSGLRENTKDPLSNHWRIATMQRKIVLLDS